MIFSPKMQSGVTHTCTKILFHGFEISIAMDDSCGAMNHMGRTEIRVYKDDKDVTEQYARRDTYSAEGLYEVMSNISSWHG